MLCHSDGRMLSVVSGAMRIGCARRVAEESQQTRRYSEVTRVDVATFQHAQSLRAWRKNGLRELCRDDMQWTQNTETSPSEVRCLSPSDSKRWVAPGQASEINRKEGSTCSTMTKLLHRQPWSISQEPANLKNPRRSRVDVCSGLGPAVLHFWLVVGKTELDSR